MKLDGLLDSYLYHLRVERALSPHTLAAYARDLNKLVGYAEQQGVVSAGEIDLGAVTGWLSELLHSGLGARSAARHLSALRGFARFLVREGLLHHDPDGQALLVDPAGVPGEVQRRDHRVPGLGPQR